MGSSQRSRIVVPTGRGTRQARSQKNSSRPTWMSPALRDAAIVAGTRVATTLFLLLLSGQLSDTTSGTLIARSAPPALSLYNASPSPLTSPAGPTPTPQVRHEDAASPSPAPSAAESETAPDDSTIQAAIDRKFQDSGDLGSYGLTVTISDGVVTVVGTVPSDEVKGKVERLIKSVKGVKRVDNQI